MKKICHMTSAHETNDGRIFRKECTSLAQCGYDVYLVGGGESREENGVHVVGVGENEGGRLNRMLRFSRKVYMAALAVDADVYHLHDPELLLYGLKLKKKGKKVIFDSHEIYAQQIKNKKYLGAFAKIVACVYEKIERYIVKRLDGVIVVTPQMVTIFQKYQPNIAIIGNYPILQDNLHKESERKPQLCFAGNVAEQWNHETVLRAMEQIPQINYKLCGPVDSEEYLSKLKAMHASDRMDYMGVVPFAQAQEMLQSSAIGVALLSPSGNTDGQNGTLGNTKLFEIMMAGLPVICTDFVLWKEIIAKYECGICVAPNDADALAAAIRYIMDNPEKAKQMGDNGIRAVHETYNWDKLVEELNNIYQKVGR